MNYLTWYMPRMRIFSNQNIQQRNFLTMKPRKVTNTTTADIGRYRPLLAGIYKEESAAIKLK